MLEFLGRKGDQEFPLPGNREVAKDSCRSVRKKSLDPCNRTRSDEKVPPASLLLQQSLVS